MTESEVLRRFKMKKKKKTAKKTVTRRCTGCGKRGHNVRTCQGS